MLSNDTERSITLHYIIFMTNSAYRGDRRSGQRKRYNCMKNFDKAVQIAQCVVAQTKKNKSLGFYLFVFLKYGL